MIIVSGLVIMMRREQTVLECKTQFTASCDRVDVQLWRLDGNGLVYDFIPSVEPRDVRRRTANIETAGG